VVDIIGPFVLNDCDAHDGILESKRGYGPDLLMDLCMDPHYEPLSLLRGRIYINTVNGEVVALFRKRGDSD
jgi:hypothetical protein